jgi:adenylate cyclase
MTNPDSETRLSVIMFSDIVGYSRMMNEDEEMAMMLLDRHNKIVRDALKRHDGKEIKVIGDAFLVNFSIVVTGQ